MCEQPTDRDALIGTLLEVASHGQRAYELGSADAHAVHLGMIIGKVQRTLRSAIANDAERAARYAESYEKLLTSLE